MKCPLIIAGWNAAREGEMTYNPGCLTKECAWYDIPMDECSVRVIARCMVGIQVHLHNIAEDMPKEVVL